MPDEQLSRNKDAMYKTLVETLEEAAKFLRDAGMLTESIAANVVVRHAKEFQ